MMEQPLPGEVEGLNYSQLQKSRSFIFSLDCLQSSIRSDKSILVIIDNPKWFKRLQQIVETWEEHFALLSIFRSFRLISRSLNTLEAFMNGFPDFGNWLFEIVERFFD
jgi:hypothetical protein